MNGATVYMRDVAHVHDGIAAAEQRRAVDGRRAVLMTVLKNGSASTLDIIDGVKRRLPTIEAALPPGVKLTLLGDQSVFVEGGGLAAWSGKA